MATIIAGGFEHISKAEDAVARLRAAGVNDEYICQFRVNPPGEHNARALGGDHDKSAGAMHAGEGAATGASIGAAIGVAAGTVALPFIGPAGIPAGAGIGGYTGSLLGSLAEVSMEALPDRSQVRPAEAMVAVNVEGSSLGSDEIAAHFEASGAQQIETALGTWTNGEWTDFDPVSSPTLIGGKDYREHRERIAN
jgi:S-formylglutathione hydrolase FrmB